MEHGTHAFLVACSVGGGGAQLVFISKDTALIFISIRVLMQHGTSFEPKQQQEEVRDCYR